MGLSIHYSGTINDTALLPALVEEVQDVCDILEWPYRLVQSEEVQGISFTPPECESVALTFLQTGELVCLVKRRFEIEPATTISVKTQFAGAEVHKAIIKLFRHLSKTYFSYFELSDESNYWETGEEAQLHAKFKQYNFLLDTVTTALQDFKAMDGDTPENLAERLEKLLRERLGRK